MREDDWQRVRSLAALVNEVDAQAIDVSAKVGKVVEHLLLRPPVEFVLPVGFQALQVVQVGARVPACPFNLIGQAGAGLAVTEVVNDDLSNGDGEGLDTHVRSPSSAIRDSGFSLAGER